ncbi:MAG: TRAP transporter substrate-binding protein DctP, partial [Burkholderiales bacterium]|nr:TRAP transporter substrate-binding protein DctP [Burkholderiales bacterium]
MFKPLRLPGRAALLAATVLFSLAAGARDFRSADVHPTDYPTVSAVRYMGKLLLEQSKGRFGVRVYPSGALGTEKDNIEQLRIGALDMMRINIGVLNSVVPETTVTVLPFVFRSTA